MPSYPLTIHLGSGKAGEERTRAYKEYAEAQKKSISEIIVAVMDGVVGFTPPTKPKGAL